MLRKLMKHEFRATGRVMLPLFLIVLVTAIGANLSTRGLLETDYWLLNMLGGLLVVAFVVAIVAVCIMSIVVMVQRFYKNLLQDEGYVMMTLPVSVHQQVWSKLIVSAVWFAATFLVVCLAMFVMVFDLDFVKDILGGLQMVFRQITSYYALNGAAFVLELLVLCFVGCCGCCLEFYAALAVGHSRPTHKMAWSVLFFFAFQFAMQLITGVVMGVFGELGLFDGFIDWVISLTETGHVNGMVATHLMLGGMIVVTAVYGVIYYFVTTYFLKKHLNLE